MFWRDMREGHRLTSTPQYIFIGNNEYNVELCVWFAKKNFWMSKIERGNGFHVCTLLILDTKWDQHYQIKSQKVRTQSVRPIMRRMWYGWGVTKYDGYIPLLSWYPTWCPTMPPSELININVFALSHYVFDVNNTIVLYYISLSCTAYVEHMDGAGPDRLTISTIQHQGCVLIRSGNKASNF